MKTRRLIAVVAVALLLAACIPSVNPFYTDKDLVFAPALLGQWQTKDKSADPEGWLFEKAGTNYYKLTITEKQGKRGEFEAHLFKLKGNYFLDLIPAEINYATNQADLAAAAMFPGHLLAHVPQIGPELQLAFCNFDWLEKYLKEHPKALEHRLKDSSILLTADTDELQKFILKHLGTNELFSPPGELIRETAKP